MTASLRKNADAATIGEPPKHGLIDGRLIYVGRVFEFGALKVARGGALASELPIIRDIRPARQLIQRVLRSHRLLEDKLLGAANLRDGGTERIAVDGGKVDGAFPLESLFVELRSTSPDERGVIHGIGEVYRAHAGLHIVHCSRDGHGANASGEQTDELAAEGFLRNEPRDATVRFIADDPHQNQGVDELHASTVSAGHLDDAERIHTWFA